MDQQAGQHPIDRLIRELIQTGRAAAPDEIEQIIERMATAPFEPRTLGVPDDERTITYLARTLGTRVDSLFYHLVKRVIVEGQWAEGTTADQYLSDLRQVVRSPGARLAVYERRGGHIAATVTPTALVIPSGRMGPVPQASLLVVYSADRGIIVTGYQFSDLGRTGIPREPRWLK